MTFGEKIKSLREQNGITQDELAERLYVTRTAVSKWENDKGLPSIDTLKRIAELFGVTLDEPGLGRRRKKREARGGQRGTALPRPRNMLPCGGVCARLSHRIHQQMVRIAADRKRRRIHMLCPALKTRL